MEQEKCKEDNSDRQEWAHSLLQKYRYWKLLRITAFLKIVTDNCRNQEKRGVPLSTEVIEAIENIWLRYSQENQDLTCGTELRKYSMGIWRCFGRIEGYYPVLIPKKSLVALKVVENFIKPICMGECNQQCLE